MANLKLKLLFRLDKDGALPNRYSSLLAHFGLHLENGNDATVLVVIIAVSMISHGTSVLNGSSTLIPCFLIIHFSSISLAFVVIMDALVKHTFDSWNSFMTSLVVVK